MNRNKPTYEELLQKTDQQELELLNLKRVINSTHVAMHFYSLEKDEKLIFTRANPAADDILGINHNELIGKEIEQAFPGLASTEIPEIYRKVAKGEIKNYSFKVPYHDERITGHYDAHVYSLQNNQIAINFFDITEKKKAENNEKLFKGLFDKVADAIFIFNPENFEIIEANKATSKMYGYSQDELIGMSCLKLSAEVEKSKSKAAEMLDKGETRVNFRHHKKKDGTDVFVELEAYKIIIDNKPVTFSVCNDITDIKRAEERLIESKENLFENEQKYRSLYNNAPLSYQSLDENACFIDINPMWEKTLGYKKDEVIGKWYGDFLHPDYVEHFRRNFPAFKKRGYVSDVQFQLRKKDGSFIYVSFEGCAGYTPEGKFKQTYCVFKDITEQKATEQAIIKAKENAQANETLIKEKNEEYEAINEELRQTIEELNTAKELTEENEHRLSSIIENTKAGYFFIDNDGLFQNINKAWLDLYKYDRYDEVIGKHYTKVQQIDDLESTKEFVDGIRNGNQDFMNGEFSRKCKDGSIGYHTFSAHPVYESNKIKGIEGFIIDTTKQKKIEQELVKAKVKAEANEIRYSHFYNASHDQIYSYDLDNRFTIANKELCKNLKRKPEEIIGKSYWELEFPEENCRDWDEMHKEAYKKGRLVKTTATLMPDGTTQYFEVKLFVIKDHKGKAIGLGGINRNITENKLNEQKLIQAKEIAEKNEIIIKEKNEEYEVINEELRQSFEELNAAKEKAEESELKLKLIADNFVKGMLYQVALIDETHRKFNYISDAVKELYGCTPEKAMQNADLVYGRLHPDDVGVLVEKEKIALKNMSIFEAESRVIKPDGSIRWAYYISKPRIIDGIACWDGIELDITVRKQMELELLAAKEKAEESDRLKTAFLQNMSHEIRTPLNAISGFAGMLNKPKLSEEKRRNFISIIQSSGSQLISIVSDILTISSLETKQEKANIGEVCINNTIVNLLSIFNQQSVNQNISLYAKRPLNESQSEIYTDKTKITQILSNLLTNAFKFTHEGFIEFGYILKNKELEFYVKDSGIGIEPELQEKIFDRFQQVDVSNTKYRGTGLGLAISRAFAELLGGKIWVDSESGKGSTFYFTIPYKPVNKTDRNSKEINSEQNTNTILVAEDEENNFLYIEELLSELNYNIIHAKNGQEAVHIVESNPNISLILMDIKMPLMDGFTAAKIIKKQKPDLPIVAQSAHALEHEIEKYSGIFDDYLAKPISEELFREKVNKYMRNNYEN